MPELPDLTVYAENLDKAVAGKKVDRIVFHNWGRLNVAREELTQTLEMVELVRVERTGKQISFLANNGAVLRVHLMLTGGFVLTDARGLDRLNAPVLSLVFSGGSALAVTDPKGWATVTLNPKAAKEVPDALAITSEYLQQLCARKPRALIKALLIDQALVGGIGNAYADEILWHARITPRSLAGKLPPDAVEALSQAIPRVLLDAVEQLKKRHPGMVSGEYREFLKVHRPGLKTSPTGAPIIKETIASKGTYYTNEQQLYM